MYIIIIIPSHLYGWIRIKTNRVNVLKIWGELPAKYSLTIESTVDFLILHTVQTVYEKLINKPKSLTSLLGELVLLSVQL